MKQFSFTSKNVFLLKRSIDLSLLRQGFHIPPEFHALVYAAIGRELHHGESCDVHLLVGGENTVRSQLNWSQYRLLIQISDSDKREYYELEAVNNAWTGREINERRKTITKNSNKFGFSLAYS